MDPDVFLVERILRSRMHRKTKQYLIRWLGYSQEHDTWEPAINVSKDLIDEFNSKT